MIACFFVCREKGTDKYFIEPPKWNSGGYTFLEPSLIEGKRLRLFSSEKAAKAAIAAWAQGKLTKTFHRSSDIWGEDDHETLQYIPVIGRHKDNIEIIPVSIQEIK